MQILFSNAMGEMNELTGEDYTCSLSKNKIRRSFFYEKRINSRY